MNEQGLLIPVTDTMLEKLEYNQIQTVMLNPSQDLMGQAMVSPDQYLSGLAKLTVVTSQEQQADYAVAVFVVVLDEDLFHG